MLSWYLGKVVDCTIVRSTDHVTYSPIGLDLELAKRAEETAQRGDAPGLIPVARGGQI